VSPKLRKKLLSAYDRLEILEYTHAERVELFEKAIEGMAQDGILSSTEVKDYLKNISKWLLEEFEV
jgi:hypothetical protein